MNSELITFTHQVAMSLHRMGLAGAAVNRKTYVDLGTQWTQEAAQLHDKLMKMALRAGMTQFSATMDEHVREMIYDRMHYPVLVKTRKDKLPAIDKPTLKRLIAEHEPSQFIDDFIAFNAADKLLSTWIGKEDRKKNARKSVGELIEAIPGSSSLGLLHFWAIPLKARTGRRASGGTEEDDPEGRNAQNWPSKARKMIISRWRGGKIAVGDFSKLEMVIMGWLAPDEKLLDYFLNGAGYIGIAKEFWGQDVEDGSSMYKATKCIVLGLNYNMKAWHLANDLWFKIGFKFSEDWDEHFKQTIKARKRYLRMFPGLANYIRATLWDVRENQRIVSPSGRVRHLPHHGPDSEGYWHVENSAVNYRIQSTASEITGSALVDYEEALLKEHRLSYTDWHSALIEKPWSPPCSPVFNEVHDELDIDLHPKSGKRDLEILVDCMQNVRSFRKLVPDFDIKLKVDVQIVPTWGDAK
jgi:DNA polymerase I-like protein with 3'-5' exonuclease and polymerase domains